MAICKYESFKKTKKKNHFKRIGLDGFPATQVDTLAFQPLAKKVMSIFNGNPDFRADDTIETDFDEPAQETWDDSLKVDDQIGDNFPIDEYSDKVDVIEVNKKANEKLSEYNSQVQQILVDEARDKAKTKQSDPGESKTGSGEKSSEK